MANNNNNNNKNGIDPTNLDGTKITIPDMLNLEIKKATILANEYREIATTAVYNEMVIQKLIMDTQKAMREFDIAAMLHYYERFKDLR